MKRMYSVCLAAAMLLGCAPVLPVLPAAAAVQTENGFQYETDGKTAVITGAANIPSGLNIPAEIGGVPVTAIGANAFAGAKILTLTLPESLLSIGSGAFAGCKSLIRVELPKHVTEVQDSAFENCTTLRVLSLPAGLEHIGSGAFRGDTALTTVTLPKMLNYIGDEAFRGCTGLTEIAVPTRVTCFGTGAFRECGIEKATVRHGVTRVPESAFADCAKLTTLHLAESVTAIDDTALTGCGALQTVIGYPDTFAETFALAYQLNFVALDTCDINGDGIITVADAVFLARSLTEGPGGVPADVNRDGWLDIDDLLTIAARLTSDEE